MGDVASVASNINPYHGPYFDGIQLKDLNKGDLVAFDAVLGENVKVVVVLDVIYPKQAGVKVATVIRLGDMLVEIPKKDLGLDRGIREHFVLTGEIEGESELGWIGLGADVRLTPNFKFEAVRNIRLNGNRVLFDESASSRH